jgi:hypothetical protein
MNLSVMLDVIIGMAFIFLMFSLIASAINEAIAALLDSRSRWLLIGIRRLLEHYNSSNRKATVDDTAALAPPGGYAHDPVHYFFDQPLISFLGRRPTFPMGTPKGQSPNTIPPVLALPALLNAAQGKIGKTFSTLDEIDEVLKSIPPSSLKSALEQIRSRGHKSYAEFEAEFMQWFEAFGDEIGRWYRQKTHFVLMWIGVILCFSVNLDAIALIKHLSMNQEARATLVNAAKTQAGLAEPSLKTKFEAKLKAGAKLDALKDELKERGQKAKQDCDAKKPKDTTCTSAPSPEELTSLKKLEENFTEASKAHHSEIDGLYNTFSKGSIPLGWDSNFQNSISFIKDPFGWLQTILNNINALKLLGILLSGLALSLGAPMWFDLLKKLVSIRSVGETLKESDAKKALARAK